MADKKITQLTQVNSLTGAELLPLAQDGVTKSASVEQLRGYKVYTALLTQSGGGGEAYSSGGDLVIGVSYRINNLAIGMDFTNVGALNNNIGTWFVATGTTPNSWGIDGDEVLYYNPGAPVVTVLENTIGNVWFEYDSVGIYKINSSGLFTIDKTTTITSQSAWDDTGSTQIYVDSSSLIFLETLGFFPSIASADNIVSRTMLEIRVYN
jgi:hypothetical protein